MENIKNYLSANLQRFVECKSLAALILSHAFFMKDLKKQFRNLRLMLSSLGKLYPAKEYISWNACRKILVQHLILRMLKNVYI